MTAPKHNVLRSVLALIGVLLFNYIFWGESLGLNLLLFTVYANVLVFWLYPKSRKQKTVWALAAGSIVGSITTVIYNTGIAEFVALSSLGLLIGFACHTELKSLISAGLASFLNLATVPVRWFKWLVGAGKRKRGLSGVWRWTKLVVIPVLVLILFFVIYNEATPALSDITDEVSGEVDQFFANIFENLPIGRIFFILFGFLVFHALAYGARFTGFIQWESLYLDRLFRSKKAKTVWRTNQQKRQRKPPFRPPVAPAPQAPYSTNIPTPPVQNSYGQPGAAPYYQPYAPKRKAKMKLKLKAEFRIAVLTFAMLNALILLVNSLDVYHLWFAFDAASTNMTQLVHSGTALLIFAIILSMGVLLYFFRGNLNFYRKNKALKTLGIIWMVQNGIMAISVGVKNWHYIKSFGLAYGRVQVYVFLFLAIAGMITLVLKVKKHHTLWLLIRRNSWIMYATLVAMCFINWDMLILQYNLNQAPQEYMNVPYNINLSDKTLGVIENNRQILSYENDHEYDWMFRDSWDTSLEWGRGYLDIDYELHHRKRVKAFLERKAEESWLSWNLAEAQALEDLRQAGLTAETVSSK